MKRKGGRGWRRQQCGDWDPPGCDLRSFAVCQLRAGCAGNSCPSGHDKSLLSTALFPLTTTERMEADQRSIYVGNVSGSPEQSCAQLGVCPKSLAWGLSAPHQSLAVPSVSRCPKCFSSAQPENVALYLSLTSVSSPKALWQLWVVWCHLFPLNRAGCLWVCVSRWEHSAGRVPWPSGEAELCWGV